MVAYIPRYNVEFLTAVMSSLCMFSGHQCSIIQKLNQKPAMMMNFLMVF